MQCTISIELDQPAADRLERAARYRNQSPGAFVAQASEAAAHQALLDEAVSRYQQDAEASSVSELAAENGLAVEELMLAIRDRVQAIAAESGQPAEEIVRGWYHSDPADVEKVFLAGSRTVAEELDDPQSLERAREAVAAWRQRETGGRDGTE